MQFSTFMSSFCSDAMLMKSASRYLNSLTSKSTELIEKLSDVLANTDVTGYVVPDLSNYALATDINGKLIPLDAQEFADKLYQGIDSYDYVFDNVKYHISVDDVIDQLSGSLKVNKVISESINVLVDSAEDNASAIISNFKDRLSINVGDITDEMQSAASSLLSIITTKGASVGDRLRSILNFAGFTKIDDNEDPANIGLPQCDLSDITGQNCATALFNTFPKTIFQVGEWIRDTFSKIIKMLNGILQTIVGSSVYRSITKFFSTLTGKADSFAFNNGAEEGNSISNFGRIWRIDRITPNDPWVHDCSDIHGIILTLLNSNDIGTVITGSTIYNDLNQLLNIVNGTIPPSSDSLIFKVQLQNALAYNANMPEWLKSQINQPEDTIYNMLCRVYGSMCYRLYPIADVYSEPLGIIDIAKIVLNSILDVIHANDPDGLTNKLNSTEYLCLSLPGSEIYFWLDGADVCCTRRVSPLSYYKDMSFNDIETKIMNSFGFSGFVIASFNPDKCAHFISMLRTAGDVYIETDKQMLSAVYAANLLDTLFLYVLDEYYKRGIKFNDELPTLNDLFVPRVGALVTIFPVLTGYSHNDYCNTFGKLTDGEIRNITLAHAVGAGDLSTIRGDSRNAMLFKTLLNLTSVDDMFIPYSHESAILVGRYRIISDTELAGVFTTLLKIVTAVAAAILALKIMGKLKRKAMMCRTKADAVAWGQVLPSDGSAPSYGPDQVKAQYKLYKQANRAEKLSQAIFGSLGKALHSVTGAVSSSISSVKSSVSQIITGRNSSDIQEPKTIADIARLITG